MAWTNKKIEEVYKKVEIKAAKDKKYRQLLLTDAGKAINQVSDDKVPDGLKIKFIEKDPSYNATFVLPDLMSDEINEEDLDKVAGGVSGLLIASVAAIFCAAAVGIEACVVDACGAKAEAAVK